MPVSFPCLEIDLKSECGMVLIRKIVWKDGSPLLPNGAAASSFLERHAMKYISLSVDQGIQSGIPLKMCHLTLKIFIVQVGGEMHVCLVLV